MKDKVVKLAEELSSMIFWFHGIQKTLREDFSPKCGKLSDLQIQSLPVGLGYKHLQIDQEFFFLKEEAEEAAQIIRKMCSLELPTYSGAQWFKEKEADLVSARDLINV